MKMYEIRRGSKFIGTVTAESVDRHGPKAVLSSLLTDSRRIACVERGQSDFSGDVYGTVHPRYKSGKLFKTPYIFYRYDYQP